MSADLTGKDTGPDGFEDFHDFDGGPGWANRTLGGFCAAALAAITFVLLLQVAMRYVAQSPLVWVDEVTRILMVWLTFTGAALAYRTGSHIGINAVVDSAFVRSRPWVARAAALVIEAVVLAGSLALLIGGTIMLIRTAGHTTPALQLPIAVLFLPAPLSGALVLCSAAANWTARLRPSNAVISS
ncbi:TRAP transporter small permease [Pseudonocardia sp. MH-G8]|uniref:TRAP transporter small permease n=1 Tax=Pseudonocardia sp. MH-G8 TaxID=1854588 RepID=UPI000B9FE0BA|nr:TRAP transporter small permease [Pseudonocardia sp. MH-G8]OZM76898.1 hypothetical protein CFP66_38880 [Pseudonocardia sp. MH-G8]